MNDLFYMAWRYLSHHRFKTVLLILSFMLIVYIPVGLRVMIDQTQRQLTARAESTPLLVGVKGSPLELVLNSLYFSTDIPEPTRYAEAIRVQETGLARAIPMHVRFQSQTVPLVGTTPDYFDFHDLDIAEGRPMTMLGECIVGARVAKQRGIAPGDHVISSPESVFDLAGVYPLKMRVTGILEFADTPDDKAIFIDVKTAWVIEGLAHGHEDLTRPEAAGGVLARESDSITANASVVQYNEITDDNIDSFHFHGDIEAFPLTAVIAVPNDQKSAALLMGRYQSDAELQQILAPVTVLDELLATILTVQNFVLAALLSVGAATLITAALVFMLSIRLRKREIETMIKIGGSRRVITSILATEIVTVIVFGVGLAAGLTWISSQFAASAVRFFIQ